MAQVLDGEVMAETMSGTAIRWLLDNKGEATSDIIGVITYVSEELETLYYVQD